MTLPTSGQISTDQIMAELRIANPGRAYPISTSDADVLALAGKAGPPVTIPNDFWGKSVTPAFTVTARNASGTANTAPGPGTVSCSPGVNITGATGATSCSWVVLSNPMGCAVTLGTGPSVTIRYTYTQNSNGSAEVRLRCTVTDGAGQQRNVEPTGSLQWDGNL